MLFPAQQFTGLDGNRLEHTVAELKAAIMDGNGVTWNAIDQCVNHGYSLTGKGTNTL